MSFMPEVRTEQKIGGPGQDRARQGPESRARPTVELGPGPVKPFPGLPEVPQLLAPTPYGFRPGRCGVGADIGGAQQSIVPTALRIGGGDVSILFRKGTNKDT